MLEDYGRRPWTGCKAVSSINMIGKGVVRSKGLTSSSAWPWDSKAETSLGLGGTGLHHRSCVALGKAVRLRPVLYSCVE